MPADLPRAAPHPRHATVVCRVCATMLPEPKLDALVARHQAVERELASPVTPETYVKLSREFAELAPIVETVRNYRAVVAEIAGLDALIVDAATDAEMRAMAASEKPQLEQKRAALERDLRLALVPKDAMDERNVILEIRAGTGGDEAALFAGDLFRMYERYAATQGWKVEVISSSEGTMGGFKEIVAEIRGRGAFAKLKSESAVRVTHIPTGIVVMMQEDRSQHRNRAKAMAVLRARLYDFERQKQDAARAAERRGQVGSGDRSERIRTYNFPQARVSDHRINLTLYKLPQVIEGEALGEIIDALVTEHQAELLAAEAAPT